MSDLSCCTVKGCKRSDVLAKGMCGKHYRRQRRYGTTDGPATCAATFCSKKSTSPLTTWCKTHQNNPATRSLGKDHLPGSVSNAALLRLLVCVQTDDCVEWPRARYPTGYGNDSHGYAHRNALKIATGEQPSSDLHALHSCHNPPCVNPRHLRWGTPQENIEDRTARGVWAEIMKSRASTPRRLTELELWLARGWGTGRFEMLSVLFDRPASSCAKVYYRTIQAS